MVDAYMYVFSVREVRPSDVGMGGGVADTDVGDGADVEGDECLFRRLGVVRRCGLSRFDQQTRNGELPAGDVDVDVRSAR